MFIQLLDIADQEMDAVAVCDQQGGWKGVEYRLPL